MEAWFADSWDLISLLCLLQLVFGLEHNRHRSFSLRPYLFFLLLQIFKNLVYFTFLLLAVVEPVQMVLMRSNSGCLNQILHLKLMLLFEFLDSQSFQHFLLLIQILQFRDVFFIFLSDLPLFFGFLYLLLFYFLLGLVQVIFNLDTKAVVSGLPHWSFHESPLCEYFFKFMLLLDSFASGSDPRHSIEAFECSLFVVCSIVFESVYSGF